MSTSPTHARTVLTSLNEDGWTVPHHATVATTIVTLLRAGEPVDPVTVLGQLRPGQGVDQMIAASRDAADGCCSTCSPPARRQRCLLHRIVRKHTYRRRVQQGDTRLNQALIAGAQPITRPHLTGRPTAGLIRPEA